MLELDERDDYIREEGRWTFRYTRCHVACRRTPRKICMIGERNDSRLVGGEGNGVGLVSSIGAEISIGARIMSEVEWGGGGRRFTRCQRKSFGGNVYFCISPDREYFGGMREVVTRCAAN